MHVNDNEGAKGEDDAQEGDAPGGHNGEVQVRGIGEEVEVDAEQDAACSMRIAKGKNNL